MRNTDTLINDFEDLKILYQYLYMSAEHYIDVETPATTLRISMDENLNFKCDNLRFPDLPAMNYNDMMTINQALGIIDQLKHKAGIMDYKEGQSRWEEIKDITAANISLNIYNNRKMR